MTTIIVKKMKDKDKKDVKEALLSLVMILIIFFGFVTIAGSINYGLKTSAIYLVAGVVNAFITAYAAITIYQKYLKSPKL